MNNVLKVQFAKRRPRSTLLGLTLDGSRLEGVVLRRTNGSVHVQQVFSAALTLDPLTGAPELVGREIRNHLNTAGVRERYCVVGLPLKWALTAHITMPELAEADAASFVELEAEKGFPCDVTTLLQASSTCQLAGKEKYLTLIGVPHAQVSALERVLQAAQLKPVSLSLGLTALQRADRPASDGVLALAIGETHVGLQITCGGGVAALRALEGAMEEGGRRQLATDLIARETRITLGQLPAEFREAVRRIRIFGPRDLAQDLADGLRRRFEPQGFKVEVVLGYAADEFGVQLPVDAAVSAAFSLVANPLAGRGTLFEFLPPKISAWQKFSTQYASGKLRTAGLAAAVLLLLVFGAFLYQQILLMRLRAEWKQMETGVTELNTTQQQILQYRPWYDETVRGLTILQELTTAFPEDGVVTVKTLEIRDLNTITCTGTARDNSSLQKTLDRLRKQAGVTGVSLGQIRGKSPMQFTFNFQWSEGGQNAN